ncbi:histidinol phosphate phosphatase [Helicobacter sp. 12S02634-8]|uniref:histidinol-phosphatase n=1 Tax=Helicobacter sp. 12S02634-8 TaxID=1476199 RepID=UPI000BA6F3AF|nr:histidinol-phosphatase [Helicobacter sp. 12S02634-8]PAF47334.1 histidinol phosphate phosphatase [Helicobacter sp. 12S02634-8]
MRIDLHNHTTLCHHAQGSIDAYILKAIELGIDIYGFSCHAPMDFDPKYRMHLTELPLYCQLITQAQKTYQDQIQILLGLEVDFINGKQDLLEPSVLDCPCDYLIGSVHFLDTWGFDNPEFIAQYAQRDLKDCWEQYLKAIENMAQSGYFQVVGHFDLLKIFGHRPPLDMTPHIQKTLQAIKDNHMALEINAAGLRKPIKEQYPSFEILQYAHKIDLPITFGSDAHSLDQVGFGYDDCVQIAQKIGYKQAVFFKDKIPHYTPF